MRSVVVFLGLLMAAPALAHRPSAPCHQAQMPGHDDPNCYCLAPGRMFGLGESVCLRTAEGPRLAQCQMETNVMSWSITRSLVPKS